MFTQSWSVNQQARATSQNTYGKAWWKLQKIWCKNEFPPVCEYTLTCDYLHRWSTPQEAAAMECMRSHLDDADFGDSRNCHERLLPPCMAAALTSAPKS